MSSLNVAEYRLDRLEARNKWLVVPLKELLDDVVMAVVTVAADLDVTAYDPAAGWNRSSREEATLHWLLQDSLDEERWSDVASGLLTRAHPGNNTVFVEGDDGDGERIQSTARITQPLGRAARLLLFVGAIHADYGGEINGIRYFSASNPITGVELAAERIEVRLGLRVLAGGHV